MLALWNILIILGWPLLYFYRPFRGTLRQRLGDFELGRYDSQRAGLKVLINAVSAGEVNAIAPFIRELKKLRPEAQIALLTTTDSGLEMAHTKLAETVELLTFFPLLDLPFASRRFLEKLRPDLYVTTEAELWPNIQAQCRAHRIKTALVNGRLYMHNKRGWRGTLARQLLGMLDLIVCQDERQRGNFMRLGIETSKLTVSGNIKFDFELPQWSTEQLAQWRENLGLDSEDKVIVAGSTHEGEEELLLDALVGLEPNPRLIIAPRHIERAAEVAGLCAGRGLGCARLTQLEPGAAWDVLLIDRYGVLADCYRLADIVVMGGTFHPRVGGHNLLEATALGKPVIVGPHTFGITAQLEVLDAAGGVTRVDAETRLTQEMAELLDNPARAGAIGQAAQEVTLANRGSAARAAEQVLSLESPR